MKDDLKDPKPVSGKEADFLRTERPSDEWKLYRGEERYKFADKLPTTSRSVVEKWDWLLVITSAGVSGLTTLIEAHRPEPKRGKQDADLYLYRYGKNPGEGGIAYHLAHPTYTGRSIPLETAPISGLAESALAQMIGLPAESGPTGLLTEENRKSLNHIEAIIVGAAKKNS